MGIIGAPPGCLTTMGGGLPAPAKTGWGIVTLMPLLLLLLLLILVLTTGKALRGLPRPDLLPKRAEARCCEVLDVRVRGENAKEVGVLISEAGLGVTEDIDVVERWNIVLWSFR